MIDEPNPFLVVNMFIAPKLFRHLYGHDPNDKAWLEAFYRRCGLSDTALWAHYDYTNAVWVNNHPHGTFRPHTPTDEERLLNWFSRRAQGS